MTRMVEALTGPIGEAVVLKGTKVESMTGMVVAMI